MAAIFWYFSQLRATIDLLFKELLVTFEQSYSFNEQWVKEYGHISKLLDLIWLPIIQPGNKNVRLSTWHYLTIKIFSRTKSHLSLKKYNNKRAIKDGRYWLCFNPYDYFNPIQSHLYKSLRINWMSAAWNILSHNLLDQTWNHQRCTLSSRWLDYLVVKSFQRAFTWTC